MKAIMLSMALLASAFAVAPSAYAAGPVNHAAEATSDQLIEVTVESVGSLGVEILYQVDNLADVVNIRISGPLDDTDWVTISNLSKAVSIDMKNARTAKVPDGAFRKCTSLEQCILPSTLTEIGNDAFRDTKITDIEIPASVLSIGNYVFAYIKTLTKVTFEENAQLSSLGEYAFRECTNLESINLPDYLTEIRYASFYYCDNLKDLKLPANLVSISGDVFCHTISLKNIEFPASLRSIGTYSFYGSGLESVILPPNLTTLEYACFGNCQNITEVQLPAYLSVDNLSLTFARCPSITKVIYPQLTPVTPIDNPFYYVDLSNATLVVPDVSVALYKLHPYWIQFGKIEGGAPLSKCVISDNFVLSGERRIDGCPDMEIVSSGKFLINGHVPQAFSSIKFYNELPDNRYAQIISNCSALTSDSIEVVSYVYSDRWYFISPIVDVNISDVSHSDPDASFIFRYYDGEKRATEGSGGWSDLVDTKLYAGQGYIFRTNRSGNIIYKAYDAEAIAKMTAGVDVVTELAENASESEVHAGWNYIANPYPSYFDSHYIDYTAPITVWDSYRNTYNAVSLIDDNYVLRPMEAFFTQRPEGISQVSFLKEGRQTSSTPVAHAPAKTKASNRQICNVLFSGNGSSDKTRVVLNPESSISYEISRDAAKFMSHDLSTPQIASIDSEGCLLAINERPEADGTAMLSMYFPSAGSYTLAVDNEDFMLVDSLNGTSASSLTVTVDSSCTIDSRFYLTLPAQSESGVADIDYTGAAWTLTVSGSSVTIVGGDKDANVAILTVDGRTVYQASVKANSHTAVSLEQGLYIASADGKAVKFIVK